MTPALKKNFPEFTFPANANRTCRLARVHENKLGSAWQRAEQPIILRPKVPVTQKHQEPSARKLEMKHEVTYE